MSDTQKITIKEVKLSGETKGMKLVTATVGTETKVYKFSELKQDGTPRKGWTEVKEGEYNAYINGEYIASAYPVQAGFKGGGSKYNPETQAQIVKQNALSHAVILVGEAGTLEEKIKKTLETAEKLFQWVVKK